MTGEIVRFEGPRDPRPEEPSAAGSLAGLERQITRVAQLLEELEILTRTSNNIPPVMRHRALLLAKRARRAVQPWSWDAGPAEPHNDCEADPQPVIDDEKVERMYRDLNADR